MQPLSSRSNVDPAAALELAEPIIRRYVRHILRRFSSTEHEDASQNVRVRLIEKIIPAHDPARGSMEAYLYRAIQNAVTDEHRRLKLERSRSLGTLDDDDLVAPDTRFDASRGLTFQTFASTRIRGSIYDGLRSVAHRPRNVLQKQKQIDAVKARLTDELQRPPLPDEVMERWGKPKGGKLRNRDFAAAAADEQFDQTVLDSLVGREHEKSVAAIEARDIINYTLNQFGMVNALILRCCYLEQRTRDEAGEWVGTSGSAVSARISNLLRQLKVRLAA